MGHEDRQEEDWRHDLSLKNEFSTNCADECGIRIVGKAVGTLVIITGRLDMARAGLLSIRGEGRRTLWLNL